MKAENLSKQAAKLTVWPVLFFFIAIAALLSACADSQLDEDFGKTAEISGQIDRLCVTFADYDNSVNYKDLKAVLSIRQKDVKAAVSGKADCGSLQNTVDEEPIPCYSEEEKTALIEQEEAEQAASDYEEEPLDQEPEALQPSETDAGQIEENAPEAEEASVSDGEAIPEEQAEIVLSDENDNNAPEAKTSENKISAVEADSSEDELMHGNVPNSEIVLDENRNLHFYFEIDPSIYPIDIDSVSLYDVSESEDGAFLFEVSLKTSAQNSRAPFRLSWKRELQSAQARNEAESKKTELSARNEVYTTTGTIRLTNVPARPQQYIVNYTTETNPVTQIKTLKSSNNDFTYNQDNKTVEFSIKTTADLAADATIYVLSINDITNNLTCYHQGITAEDSMPVAAFYSGHNLEVLDYSTFTNGFTMSPTIYLYNINISDDNDNYEKFNKLNVLSLRSHIKSYQSETVYNEHLGRCVRLNLYDMWRGDWGYWYINILADNKYDEAVITRIDGPENYWEGKLKYSYTDNNLLSIDYNSFKNNKAVNESNMGLIGKIIITNIDYMPSLAKVYFSYNEDYSNLITQTLMGATYDKSTRTLTAYFNLTSKYNHNERDYISIKQITLDDYVLDHLHSYGSKYENISRLVDFDEHIYRIFYVDFADFSKSDDTAAYGKQLRLRISDLPYNPETFKASYTEGSSTAVKTVNIASYKNGVLTFGKIYTNASYITLKQVEAGISVYNASKRIDFSGNNSKVETVSFNDFVKKPAKSYKVYVEGVPSFGSGKVKYQRGDSFGTLVWSKADYSSSDKKLTFNMSSVRSIITLLKVVVNNRYKNLQIRLDSASKTDNKYTVNYSEMSAETVSYCQSVSCVNTKPNSSRLSYVLYNDTANVHTVSGTYDSSAKKVNFRFKAKSDVKVVSIVINGKLYNKNINLSYSNPNNTIKYANLFSTRLVVKNVPSAVNYIMVKYKLYNSKNGNYSSVYKKTSGTYSSADRTYTFPFTVSSLNGSNYDTVIVKSVALNNSVSTAERTVKLGQTYNLLSSGLSSQNTRYSVNVYSGASGIRGMSGTMTYTLNGTGYTAKGTVKYDSDNKRYVMHFETVKTKAASVKINKITVGSKYYGSSFTLKYGQNKANTDALEGLNTINTRTLSLASGFKN